MSSLRENPYKTPPTRSKLIVLKGNVYGVGGVVCYAANKILPEILKNGRN